MVLSDIFCVLNISSNHLNVNVASFCQDLHYYKRHVHREELHLNIIHFTHTFIPVYGGTTTRLMNLFMNDGNSHTIIVPGTGSQYVPKTIQHLNSHDMYGNVSVKRVSLTTRTMAGHALFQAPAQLRNWYVGSSELICAAGGEGYYDLVYGHNPMEFALAAGRKSLSSGLPLIYEVHGLMKDTLYTSKKFVRKVFDRLNNSLFNALERRIIKHASKVVVQTSSMKKRLTKEYGISADKIGIIYNGVDSEFFDLGRYREQAIKKRIELTINDKTVFSYFGFLDENNGIRFFLETLEKLPVETIHRVKVFILGRGPYTQLVRDFVVRHPFVEFIGLVEYEDMPVYYALTDVFVIPRPSNLATETLVPVKLLEAMAMEKIVLVSDVGGMNEIIQNGQNGLTYTAAHQDEFRMKIIDLAHRPLDYQQLGMNAKKSVQENYTWRKARALLCELYEEALSNRH